MSIKTFACTAKDRLTANFLVSEYRCHCGQCHDTILDTALPEKVQLLMAAIGAVKAIVSSGYRCAY